MRTGIRVWVCGVILLLLIAGRADAAPPGTELPGDQCRVKAVGPLWTQGADGDAYMWGEFINQCKRPMLEMGAYACLEEVEYPGDAPRLISCSANRDRPVLYGGHETELFMIAICKYTTVPRYYQISGYGWAKFLPNDGGQIATSVKITSKTWKRVRLFKGNVRYCHIPNAYVKWRDHK